MIHPCTKSKDGLHNFPIVGCDCVNGCGTNQGILSGSRDKLDKVFSTSFKTLSVKVSGGIHSELHALVKELREEFGETATKGVGSFGYYLGILKRIDIQKLYRIRAEIKQGNGHTPKKLFWWHVGKEMKEMKGV